MNEVRERPEIILETGREPERPKSKPKKKVGVFEIQGFDKIEYNYWVLGKLDGNSSLFRKHLLRWSNDRGMIGVMFGDSELAWSMKVPRHISLENQEGKLATARIQTQKPFFNQFPEIKVHAINVDDVIKLASFAARNAPSPQVLMDITLVDSLTDPSGKYKSGFCGPVFEYDSEKVKEKLNS